MLDGRERTVIQQAIGSKTLLALEEELATLAAALAAIGSNINAHDNFLRQTRRVFGGRQPVCGMGVTSVIFVI